MTPPGSASPGEPRRRGRTGRLASSGVLGGNGHRARPPSARGLVGRRRGALGDVGAAALNQADARFWRRRRVLVTGHTGFKGAWLCLRLVALGAEVTGMAKDPPTRPAPFDLVGLRDRWPIFAPTCATKPRCGRRDPGQARGRLPPCGPVPGAPGSGGCAARYARHHRPGLGSVVRSDEGRSARAVVAVTSDKVYRTPMRAAPSPRMTRCGLDPARARSRPPRWSRGSTARATACRWSPPGRQCRRRRRLRG